MNRYINQLLQLHDLELTLHENEVIHRGKNLDSVKNELHKDVAEIKNSLPPEILAVYERISQRYAIPISPMIKGGCTGCYMKLPIGLQHSIMSDKNWVCCPSCSRFLYHDESQKEGAATELHYKGLAKFSSPELMLPRISAETKEKAIKKVAQHTVKKGFVMDSEEFIRTLLEREAITSTAVEAGIAFPHARGVKACGLTLSVATLECPIESPNEAPISIILLSAVPRQTSMFYLELISKLAQYFGKEDNISKFLKCETSDEMWKLMVKIGK